MRFIFLIVTIIYLAASTGATVHLHYCMGRIADVDLMHHAEKVCGLCGMEKPADGDNGCCKDETETIKISIDQKTTLGQLFLFEQPFTDIIALQVPVLPGFKLINDEKVPPVSHAPPRSRQVPIYLIQSNFRI